MRRRSKLNISFIKIVFLLSIFLLIYLIYSTIINTLAEIKKKQATASKEAQNRDTVRLN